MNVIKFPRKMVYTLKVRHNNDLNIAIYPLDRCKGVNLVKWTVLKVQVQSDLTYRMYKFRVKVCMHLGGVETVVRQTSKLNIWRTEA